MELGELLTTIEQVAQSIGTSTPYICGGTPRDKYMDRVEAVSDIDLTTGDKTIQHLAKEVSIKLRGPNTSFKTMPDGHSKLTIDGISVDFSSNFIMPGMDPLLTNNGLENPTEMQKELYSRDFTCNALLMSLDLKNLSDPIGLGMQDINNKIIRTCVPARLTLGHDNKRVVRVIYMAAKLGFDVDPEIKEWIKANPETISTPSNGYVIKKLKQAFGYNEQITLSLLDELGLWQHLPPSDELTKYISQDVRRI